MPADAPRLIAITDLELLPAASLVERATELCRLARPGGVAVLLRDHAASGLERLALGRELRRVTRDAEQELWVADRLDLALLLDADGVHLGEASVSAADARRLLGPERRLSRAWHAPDVSGPLALELTGVDALLVSPVLDARHGRPSLGLAALSRVARDVGLLPHAPRAYALGGVQADSAAACLGAGAWGVAAIGAAFGGEPGPLLAALGVAP